MQKDQHHLDNYNFDLPQELIAHEACHPKENARLLVIDRKSRSWSHHHVYDLPEILSSEDVVVVNDSKVLRARILAKRIHGGSGSVECFLIRKVAANRWVCMMRASARIDMGFCFEKTMGSNRLEGRVLSRFEQNGPATFEVEFDQDPLTYGKLPFPPYIERSQEKTLLDDEREYQTVFADSAGSVAAPTAGLHFSERLLTQLGARGIDLQKITLHVGLGTFQPIKVENVEDHKMHEETFEISTVTSEVLNRAREEKKSIVAVGTTSFRTLQSAFDEGEQKFRAGMGVTDLYVYPKDQPQSFVVDKLMTNFHLPKSSLLLLVSAFADRDLILTAYEDAIKERYRFFSLGDAMLII